MKGERMTYDHGAKNVEQVQNLVDGIDWDNMYSKSVSILGETYTIEMVGNEESDTVTRISDLKGSCRKTEHKIMIVRPKKDLFPQDAEKMGMIRFINKTVRHEITHAFIYESGLDGQTKINGPWSKNEEIVDWFAIQGPKIMKAWQEANCID